MSFLPTIYLIDNGSLRPEATLALRDLAAALSRRTCYEVEAVSLLHSSKVPAEDLGGVPAKTFKKTLARAIQAGERRFICLPMFLGPSRAITEYLPELIEAAQEDTPYLQVEIADPLAGADVSNPDIRLAEILARQIDGCFGVAGWSRPAVALVDHGTPYEPVNMLRNRVAEQLGEILGDRVSAVVASSMERRDGAEYDFNEPLLERLGQLEVLQGSSKLIAAMFFLLPGRHAGEGGDVAGICEGLVSSGSFEAIQRTELLGQDPQLLDILSDRLLAAIKKLPS